MPKKYKSAPTGRTFATRKEALEDAYSYHIAKRLSEQTKKIPISYIGGTPEQARVEFWRQEPVLQHAVDSIANEYGIDSNALKYRLDAEGYSDSFINYRNKQIKNGNYNVNRGYDILNRPYITSSSAIGLDDARDYIDSGKVKLINESWFDSDNFINEEGRVTHPVTPNTHADAIGITAAHLKYFKDTAKSDYPTISENEANRYAQAYYNRGIEGGRKWVKSGAKGYNYKRSLEEGGKR